MRRHCICSECLPASGAMSPLGGSSSSVPSASIPHPSSYANLANALRLLGLLLEAEDVLRKAVQLFPGDINMHVLLADDLARRGDFAAALTEYRAAIDLNPKLARSHHAIGVLYRLMGRLEEAVGAASVAIDLDPADPEAHLVLGDHLSIFSVAT